MDQEEDLARDHGAEAEPVALGEGLQAAAGRDHLSVLRVPGDEYVSTLLFISCVTCMSVVNMLVCMHSITVIIYILLLVLVRNALSME